MSDIKVFVSHSHRDKELAAQLVRIIDEYLHVPPNAIRCSSVSGYQLELGALTDQQLRSELESAVLMRLVLQIRDQMRWTERNMPRAKDKSQINILNFIEDEMKKRVSIPVRDIEKQFPSAPGKACKIQLVEKPS